MLRWVVGLGIENGRVLLPFTLGSLFRLREPKFNVPPADSIKSSTSILRMTEWGPILEISFAGRYPPGSFGNEHAGKMQQAALRAILDHKPAAVLFNLRSLNYVWGDAICGLAPHPGGIAIQREIPSCVFATGRTATALTPLFAPGWLFHHAGMRLFRDHDQALAHLNEQLKGQAI